MYPEQGAEESYAEPAAKPRMAIHFEGFIPIILIIIIAFFLAAKFGVISSTTPVLGPVVALFGGSAGPVNMLIIGTPSPYTMEVLNKDQDLVRTRIRSAESLEHTPEAQLAQYDIVMLDQSNQAVKEVSRQLGEAIQKYVKSGGKLIVVKDSGIRRPDSPDVLGWKATFADIVPVECTYQGITNTPSCTQPMLIRGKIYAQDVRHRIMQGFEVVPPEGNNTLLLLESFDVTPNGNEIAYMQDARTEKYLPAIVEKPLVVGKSIWFNYDPGLTPGIFEATLDYLR